MTILSQVAMQDKYFHLEGVVEPGSGLGWEPRGYLGKSPETFKQYLQTIGKKSHFIKNLSNINTLQMLRLKWETTPVMFQN